MRVHRTELENLEMIRFGYLAFILFSACFDVVFSQKPCDGVLGQQFRPDPSDCRVYYLCGQGKDWRLQCGPNTVWSQETGACVPVGSPEDTCTQSWYFFINFDFFYNFGGWGVLGIYAKQQNINLGHVVRTNTANV